MRPAPTSVNASGAPSRKRPGTPFDAPFNTPFHTLRDNPFNTPPVAAQGGER